jgi:FtsH-binding integral membrane protein
VSGSIALRRQDWVQSLSIATTLATATWLVSLASIYSLFGPMPECHVPSSSIFLVFFSCHILILITQIEQKYAKETAQLNPNHRFVPWVVVNDQPLQEVCPSVCRLLFYVHF